MIKEKEVLDEHGSYEDWRDRYEDRHTVLWVSGREWRNRSQVPHLVVGGEAVYLCRGTKKFPHDHLASKASIEHGKELSGQVRICQRCASDNIKEERQRVAELLQEQEKASVSAGGCVYLMRAEGTELCKIGVSMNPKERLKTISSSSPFDISLLSTISGGYETEKQLHKKYENLGLRVKNEWFRLTDDILKDFGIV